MLPHRTFNQHTAVISGGQPEHCHRAPGVPLGVYGCGLGTLREGAGGGGKPLNEVADQLLARAENSHSGRAAQSVYGGHDRVLRRQVIALAAGHELAEHESPGEATLQVLSGRVRLTAQAAASPPGVPGLPQARGPGLPDQQLHLIMDNYATHKRVEVRDWLAANPRIHARFTPTSGSWLNLVEVWFGIVERQAIRRGVFPSVGDLTTRIRAFITGWNRRKHPFIWTKDTRPDPDQDQRAMIRTCGWSSAG